MTNFYKLATIAAALSMGSFLATGAFAESSDTPSEMTCGEYMAMDAEGQHAASMELQSPKAGKDYEQAIARGDDLTGYIADYCQGGDELLISDFHHHPSEGGSNGEHGGESHHHPSENGAAE